MVSRTWKDHFPRERDTESGWASTKREGEPQGGGQPCRTASPWTLSLSLRAKLKLLRALPAAGCSQYGNSHSNEP